MMSTVDLANTAWRRSSDSGGTGGGNDNCVEVAFTAMSTGIRDSKNVAGPVLAFPVESFAAFLRAHSIG
jgi:Domain of unknown function (DUF397)